MNINQITISGRLVADAETLRAGQSEVVKFKVASNQPRKVNDEWQDDATFFNCEAWHRSNIADKLTKGLHVTITGRMKCDQYDKDGRTNYYWKVVVFQIDFVNPKAEGGTTQSKTNDLPF